MQVDNREDMRNAYKTYVGKSEGKRPLGRPRHRWKNNIRRDARDVRWEVCGLDSSGLGEGPLAGCCKSGDETSCSIKGRKYLD
jgi:hypothetical protein